MTDSVEQTCADPLRVHGRDGLAEFVAGHPVDAHGDTYPVNVAHVVHVVTDSPIFLPRGDPPSYVSPAAEHATGVDNDLVAAMLRLRHLDRRLEAISVPSVTYGVHPW